MEIIKEKFATSKWTAGLDSLIIKEECLLADIGKYESIRQQATRLTKKTGKVFSFRRERDIGKVKVWRIK